MLKGTNDFYQGTHPEPTVKIDWQPPMDVIRLPINIHPPQRGEPILLKKKIHLLS
jgi:hypothetical protein